mmetsp:Transcript_14434/g.31067  ORF Transcript_14434/g.31067 Transcript_14434/m.31067 type:complete len:255 (+) Transcript_14434:654-1418(+)
MDITTCNLYHPDAYNYRTSALTSPSLPFLTLTVANSTRRSTGINKLSRFQPLPQLLEGGNIVISQHRLGIAIPRLLTRNYAYRGIVRAIARMVMTVIMPLVIARQHVGYHVHIGKRDGIETSSPRVEFGYDLGVTSLSPTAASPVMVLPVQRILQHLCFLHNTLPSQYPPFVLGLGHSGRLDEEFLLSEPLLDRIGTLSTGNQGLSLGRLFTGRLDRSGSLNALDKCRRSESALGRRGCLLLGLGSGGTSSRWG